MGPKSTHYLLPCRLATALWQNLLPSINVQRVKLSGCQRVVLLSHDKETSIISLRHYSISVAPSGLWL
jgi:ribosome biogenesis protein SSF1/2